MGVRQDDIVGVQLNRPCSSSSFAVYGQDRDVPETALRHIRVAYSMDGERLMNIERSFSA